MVELFCYTASPFWTRYEILVKKRMIARIKEQGMKVLDPEVCGNLSQDDYDDKFNTAKQIFLNNIVEIDRCDCLVFPRFTNDLGTLYEIGRAAALGKTIWRYDFLSDTVECLGTKDLTIEQYMEDEMVEVCIDNTHKAVLFGYLSAKLPSEKLIYSLKGGLDNLMLSVNYTFRTASGNLVRPEDRDWEGIR